MSTTLCVLAPAKLNLFLHITGRRPDGYHELQTLFQLLDWGDQLLFTPNHSGVVTLESERPHAERLTLLQDAMKLAVVTEDKQLAIERASTVRTIETVTWIAQYLDDAELGQAACQAIVELAHHRFLRHPNMDRFGPILDQVGRISKDVDVVERAKRYRLGL